MLLFSPNFTISRFYLEKLLWKTESSKILGHIICIFYSWFDAALFLLTIIQLTAEGKHLKIVLIDRRESLKRF